VSPAKRRQERVKDQHQHYLQRKKLVQQALDNPNNPSQSRAHTLTQVRSSARMFSRVVLICARHLRVLPSTEMKRDPGVPDLSALHESLERRAISMDTDLKQARSQAYAKRRVAEQERKEAKRRGGESSAAMTSQTGGKLHDTGDGRMANDARDVASRHHYWSEMVRVVDASDIILEVLDARDPEGCRCREVETMIQSKMDRSGATPKRIILVLNKIDLVPHDNLLAWIKHSRREFPTIAFKSNTQQQSSNLKQTTHVTKGADVDDKTLSRSAAVGSQALLQLLKNYSRSLNIKKQITVGIIGYPNGQRSVKAHCSGLCVLLLIFVFSCSFSVGKSSLINSLTRARRAAVGNMPGLTKTLQTIKLDHQISLIDSPGVMFSGGKGANGEDDANMVLRNCLRFEQLDDPIAAVYKVVERCTMDQLKTCYNLDHDFEDADQFIFQVAQKRGKLGRGGVPDCQAASKIILKDWNDGKIEYFSDPPQLDDGERGADIVSAYSQEFDVAKLLDGPVVEVEDDADLKVADELQQAAYRHQIGTREILPEEPYSGPVVQKPIVTRPKPSERDAEGDMDMEEEEGGYEQEEEAKEGYDDEEMAGQSTSVPTVPFSMPSRPKGAANPFNPQSNAQMKASVKKSTKKKKKTANRAAAASASHQMDMDGGNQAGSMDHSMDS
jgi:nuclear GTP-binding protein